MIFDEDVVAPEGDAVVEGGEATEAPAEEAAPEETGEEVAA